MTMTPSVCFQLACADGALHRPALGGNELLAKVMRAADARGVQWFTSVDAYEWLNGRYPLRDVQKTLSRLKKRRLVHATPRKRVVRAGYYRGREHLFTVTKRGRERAVWWLQNHDLASIAYIGSAGEGNTLDSAFTAKFYSDWAPWLVGDPDLLRFRSPDPNSLGLLLTRLTGKEAYGLRIDGYDDIARWIHLLKADGIVPNHLASEEYIAAARTWFGGTYAEILLATLIKSILYDREVISLLKDLIERLLEPVNGPGNRQGNPLAEDQRIVLPQAASLMENSRLAELERHKERWQRDLIHRLSLLERDRYHNRALNVYHGYVMGVMTEQAEITPALGKMLLDQVKQIGALQQKNMRQKARADRLEFEKSSMRINHRFDLLDQRMKYEANERTYQQIITEQMVREETCKEYLKRMGHREP